MERSDRTGESPLFSLSQNGSGRAIGYSEYSEIVTVGRKTHVTWQDTEKGQFLTRIRTLDRASGRLQNEVVWCDVAGRLQAGE